METIGRLLITGDTHGDAAALALIVKQMEPSDALIVAGDFGFVFRDTPDEWSFLNDVDCFLRKMGSYIIYVDGNHENHQVLNKLPVEYWNGAKVHRVRSRILHVLRGEVLTLKDKNIFCFGGAFSIDRSVRVLNKSFWEEELPTDEDYCNGNSNLEKYDRIDYIVTHTCPLNLVPCLGTFHAAAEERQLQNYLQWVSERFPDAGWFFGHWHQDRMLGNRFRAIYLDLVDMETGQKIW